MKAGRVQNLYKHNATSETILLFEGSDQSLHLDPGHNDHEHGDRHDHGDGHNRGDGHEHEHGGHHSHGDHTHSPEWFEHWEEDGPDKVMELIENDIALTRHIRGTHYWYADGHVEFIRRDQIQEWVVQGYNFSLPR